MRVLGGGEEELADAEVGEVGDDGAVGDGREDKQRPLLELLLVVGSSVVSMLGLSLGSLCVKASAFRRPFLSITILHASTLCTSMAIPW